MTTLTIPEPLERIEYPDSDGLPIAENTLQWFWIVFIKEGLEVLFADDPQVFVAGSLLWYPVEGDNRLRVDPDVMVAVGRPKGDRGSYMQWREGDQPPQVVFEVLSPSNTSREMLEKNDFYDDYGVEEFYIYDPDRGTLRGSYRHNGVWLAIPEMQNWVSPRLKLVFRLDEGRLILTDPDGQRFLSTVESARQIKQLKAEFTLLQQRELAEQQPQHFAEQQQQIAEQAKARADRLAAMLRAAGIDPDQ